MIISQFPSGGGGGALPAFSYTGLHETKLDSGGWNVRFLSSGTLTMITQAYVDIFLVGSGGRGAAQDITSQSGSNTEYTYGAGGGGGYTLTQKEVLLSDGKSYVISVGAGGGASSITPTDSSEWSGASYSANGGEDAAETQYGLAAGDGGSGGAPTGSVTLNRYGAYVSGKLKQTGGSDGSSGGASDGGSGQGTTTREFGDAGGTLYASGGNSYYAWSDRSETPANSGNGGHGGRVNSSSGASGIVIIRNARG